MKTAFSVVPCLLATWVVALGIAVAGPARGSCQHQLWTPDLVDGLGVKLLLLENASFVAGIPKQEACFALNNTSGVPATVELGMIANDDSNTDLDFRVGNPREVALGAPGLSTPVTCSVVGGTQARMVTTGPIPPLGFSNRCCFDFDSVSPHSCDDLPGVATPVSFLGFLLFFNDSAHVEMVVNGGGAYDDTIQLGAGFVDSSGPACGLVSLELAPVAWWAWRRRRGRRAGRGER